MVAVPTFLVAALVADARLEGTPLPALTVEAMVLVLVAAAAGAALRAAGVGKPAYPAVLVLLLLTFTVGRLPAEYLMIDPQPWGPPFEAALIRWASLAVLAGCVLVAALRDPGPCGSGASH